MELCDWSQSSSVLFGVPTKGGINVEQRHLLSCRYLLGYYTANTCISMKRTNHITPFYVTSSCSIRSTNHSKKNPVFFFCFFLSFFEKRVSFCFSRKSMWQEKNMLSGYIRQHRSRRRQSLSSLKGWRHHRIASPPRHHHSRHQHIADRQSRQRCRYEFIYCVLHSIGGC